MGLYVLGKHNLLVWVADAMCCPVSPANILSSRVGPRTVVFIGGLLLTIGYFLTAFVQKMWMMYVTYVVVGTLFLVARTLAGMHARTCAHPHTRWLPRKGIHIGSIQITLLIGVFLNLSVYTVNI